MKQGVRARPRGGRGGGEPTAAGPSWSVSVQVSVWSGISGEVSGAPGAGGAGGGWVAGAAPARPGACSMGG